MASEREVLIVRVARSVRERLGAEAVEVSERLDVLLAQESPDVDALVELMSEQDETREAMREELAALERVQRTAYPVPVGVADPAAPIVYQCLVCGFSYPVFEVGEPVPEACPNGHGRLIKVV